MTPEAQRVAIAEACGWSTGAASASHRTQDGVRRYLDAINTPNFPNDLNAMHEAEKVLTADDQLSDYGRHLLSITKDWRPYWGPTRVAHATAAQRAEAFLRTIGKWEDGK